MAAGERAALPVKGRRLSHVVLVGVDAAEVVGRLNEIRFSDRSMGDGHPAADGGRVLTRGVDLRCVNRRCEWECVRDCGEGTAAAV